MNEMKQWAFGITISAIVGAVILFLSPEGATEKLVRAAVSLFLMCAILSPFLSNADPTAPGREECCVPRDDADKGQGG